MADTPGRTFYDRQVALLEAHDVDNLMNQYADDARLIGLDFIVNGKPALHNHFVNYLNSLGSIQLLSTDKFQETDDSIFFEATIKVSPGIARVYDVFLLKDGKAIRHFTGTISFTPNA